MSTDKSLTIDMNGCTSPSSGILGRVRVGMTHYLSAGARRGVRSLQLAHDEAAFRFLLANESKRSERSGRPFHVLLTYISGPEEQPLRMDGQVTGTLLPILSGVLRQTDYIGWYRADHVLGGVLTALEAHGPEEVSARIEQRFWRRIKRDFPSEHSTHLRVRFVSSKEVDFIKSIDLVVELGQPQ